MVRPMIWWRWETWQEQWWRGSEWVIPFPTMHPCSPMVRMCSVRRQARELTNRWLGWLKSVLHWLRDRSNSTEIKLKNWRNRCSRRRVWTISRLKLSSERDLLKPSRTTNSFWRFPLMPSGPMLWFDRFGNEYCSTIHMHNRLSISLQFLLFLWTIGQVSFILLSLSFENPHNLQFRTEFISKDNNIRVLICSVLDWCFLFLYFRFWGESFNMWGG